MRTHHVALPAIPVYICVARLDQGDASLEVVIVHDYYIGWRGGGIGEGIESRMGVSRMNKMIKACLPAPGPELWFIESATRKAMRPAAAISTLPTRTSADHR